MKICQDIDLFEPLPYAVVSSGTFDGIHLGHQKILKRLQEIAARNNGETVVLTYWPHPRLVLNPKDTSIKLLNTFAEKSELLDQLGVNHLVCIPFTKSFSEMSSDEFTRNILVRKLGTRKLVIGYDHHFGKNREGNFDQLKKVGPDLGFEVEEIPRQDIDESAISSSAIRRFLTEGSVKKAAQLLGRPYFIEGKVVPGQKIGRQIGFPTANISLEKSEDPDSVFKLIPGEGIYAVKIQVDHQWLEGMLYIGSRPTIGPGQQVIEVNIFDFDRQIYDRSVGIQFIDRIRGDVKFDSLEALQKQLHIDRSDTLRILRPGH